MNDLPWDKLTAMAMLGGLVTAFIKGWIVPGPLYDRALKKLDEEAEKRDEQARILLKLTEKTVASLDRVSRRLEQP